MIQLYRAEVGQHVDTYMNTHVHFTNASLHECEDFVGKVAARGRQVELQ